MANFLMAIRAIRNKLRPIKADREPIGHKCHKRTIRWSANHKKSPSVAYPDATARILGIGRRSMTKSLSEKGSDPLRRDCKTNEN